MKPSRPGHPHHGFGADRSADVDGTSGAANTDGSERRNREEGRRKDDAWLRALFDNALDAILIADDAGRYVDVNPAACALLGYSPAELLDLSIWDVTPTDIRDQAEARWREFGATGWQGGEYALQRKDGVGIEVEYRAVADFVPGLHLSILRDITQRKKAETALRRSEAQYRAVIETSQDGFWIIDRAGRLLEANEAYARLSGYSRDELRGMRVADLEADHSPARIAAQIEKAIREGGDLFQTRHRAKSGRIWQVEINSSYWPINDGQIFVFIRDIHRRQRSEALLKARLRLSDIAREDSLDKLLRAALDVAEQFTGSRVGFFHFVDPDQEHLTLQAWSTNTLQNMCGADGQNLHYPISQAGVWVECFHRREPVVHNDYAGLPDRRGLPEGHVPVVRELAVPIVRGDSITAIIGVGNKPEDYTDDDAAAVRELASMTMDLVERKQIEQTLRHYERIVAATPDSVALIDQNYVYLAVNDEYLRRTGQPRDRIVGRTVAEIMGEAIFRNRLKDQLDRCLAGELVEYRDWFDFAAKGRRFIDVTYAPYRDEAGAVTGIVVNARDSTDLKRAEETAQIALIKYKTLFDTFPIAITITDEVGNILETNAMAEHLLDVPRAEHQRRSLYSAEWRALRADGTLMPRAEYPAIRALKGNCLVENVQMGFVKPSNEITWISVTAAPLPLDGYGVVVAYNDITERKKAQEALRKSEEFKQAVLDSVAAHIAVLDRAGEIVAVNASWQRFAFNNPIRDAEPARNCGIGANYLEVCRRGSGPSAEGAMAVHDGIRAVLDGRLANFRLEYPCHAPFEQRWFSVMVTPLDRGQRGAVVAHSNITDLKRSEEALQIAQELLALAVDGAELGLYDAHHQTGQVEVNDIYLRMLGFAPGETAITVQGWLDAIHPDDRPHVIRIGEACTRAGRERFEAEYRVRHRSGNWIWVLDRGKGFGLDDHGQPLRSAGTRIDITERKRAEALLAENTERLQQLSRGLLSVQEEERRALAREMHDDLGQQLAALKLNLTVLERALPDAASQRRLADCAKIIGSAHEYIQNTARNLRPSMLDDLGLAAALRWYARSQAERAGCEIDVRAEIPPLPPALETAAFRIVQEAVNNAIRHGQALRIVIAVAVDAGALTLTIRDDGAGFDPAASGAKRKLGLGLISMRERVELLGGRFSLASRPGVGTFVEATMPLVEIAP